MLFAVNVEEVSITPMQGDIEKEFDQLVNNVLTLLTGSFRNAIPPFINMIMNTKAAEEINALINTQAHNTTLTGTCDPQTPSKAISWEWTTVAAGTTFSFWLFLGVVALYFRCWAPTSDPTLDSSDSETELLRPPNNDEEETDEFQSGSLMSSPRVHWIFALGVPFLLLANIALFISSNTSQGASVYLYITADGARRHLPSFFTFGLTNTVIDMWKAKVYPLSILVALFSGLW